MQYHLLSSSKPHNASLSRSTGHPNSFAILLRAVQNWRLNLRAKNAKAELSAHLLHDIGQLEERPCQSHRNMVREAQIRSTNLQHLRAP